MLNSVILTAINNKRLASILLVVTTDESVIVVAVQKEQMSIKAPKKDIVNLFLHLE